MSPRILLYRLCPEVACELRDALIGMRLVPAMEDAGAKTSPDWTIYDVVFTGPEPELLLAVLAAVAAHSPRPRVIAASRLPAEEEWLRAVEAGASDYCAAPFEECQLEALLRPPASAA